MKECTFKPELLTERKGAADLSKSIMTNNNPNESRVTTTG